MKFNEISVENNENQRNTYEHIEEHPQRTHKGNQKEDLLTL